MDDTLQDDESGFVTNMLHALHTKLPPPPPQQPPPPTAALPHLNLADTLLYKFHLPACWYFTAADGTLKKKNKSALTASNIYRQFTRHCSAPSDVAACHIDPTPRAGVRVRYLDADELHAFLHAPVERHRGCLQRFVAPKGCNNAMIEAHWSPKVCLLERRTNRHRVDGAGSSASPTERCATYDGPEHLSVITNVNGRHVIEGVRSACDRIATHVHAVLARDGGAPQQVHQMKLFFKVDARDRVWLLWCSSIRLVRTPTAAPTVHESVFIGSPKRLQLLQSSSSKALLADFGESAGGEESERRGTGELAAAAVAVDSTEAVEAGSAEAAAAAAASSAEAAAAAAGNAEAPASEAEAASAGARAAAPAVAARRASAQRPSVTGRRRLGLPAETGFSAADIVCPVSGVPLKASEGCELTHYSLIQHAKRLDATELAAGRRDAAPAVPSLVGRVWPWMSASAYAELRRDQGFLQERLRVSEEAFLECASGAMAGVRKPGVFL